MNNENGLLSAGKSGKGNLYYSYNADGNVSFGSEEIFLSNFKNKTIKMEDEFYDKGEFYKMNEELKESKKESNDKKEKVENRKDVYESLLKEMPNFINEILNGMVSDEIPVDAPASPGRDSAKPSIFIRSRFPSRSCKNL